MLEYDNVMNSQREVIYRRRKNALEGERLQLDLLNMVYDLCDDVVDSNQAKGGYENYKLQLIKTFGFNSTIEESAFNAYKPADLSAKLYQELTQHYNARIAHFAQAHAPMFRDLYVNRGATIENIIIPFSDGKKQINVIAKLDKLVVDKSVELQKSLEKYITLSVIDALWIEHLREMDDLKQSVQNASYEQKDPLLVYKFESFQLFKNFIAKVNEETISFLFRADIMVQRNEPIAEARQETTKKRYSENKDAAESALGGGLRGNAPQATQEEKIMPVRSLKIAGRNDRVSVRYPDGTVRADVKFKTVEEDIENNRCVLIEN